MSGRHGAATVPTAGTIGASDGDVVTLRPRRTMFMPFCYAEAAANLLRNTAIDPFGKIPEVKYRAVTVTAGAR